MYKIPQSAGTICQYEWCLLSFNNIEILFVFSLIFFLKLKACIFWTAIIFFPTSRLGEDGKESGGFWKNWIIILTLNTIQAVVLDGCPIGRFYRCVVSYECEHATILVLLGFSGAFDPRPLTAVGSGKHFFTVVLLLPK